jgi:ectoine hydroxylase-related dioxygenase (phytanoyl-CoA dioxygenase family)
MRKYWIATIFLLFFLIILNYLFFYEDLVDTSGKNYDIQENGFQIFRNVLNEKDIEMLTQNCNKKNYKKMKAHLLNDHRLNKLVENMTGSGYTFQDYIWIIQKSAVHTCHRDNNGDFFNSSQKYPSYTMLVYLEDMEKCLGVIPNSHKNINSHNYNINDPVIHLPCKRGDVILFNANLIHVGCINKKDDNLRVQLKVTHKDDIPHIHYYNNYNKVLNTENTMPLVIRKAQKRLSCMVPTISDATQYENIRTARGSDNGVDIGLSQKAFSYLFYGNTGFYDLPNAF